MMFYFPTGLEEQGKHLDRVQVISVETNSLVPRTNRRKLRKFLQDAWGVKPQFIKYFLKAQGFWDTERLGEPPEVRHKLYAEAEKEWQRLVERNSQTTHRT